MTDCGTDAYRGLKLPLWVAGLIVLVWGFDAAVAVRSDLFRVVDDSFFYLVVADHLAAGDGSTFNGVLRTNGYHPLWAWMLTPVAYFTSDTETYFDAALVLNRVLVLLATLLLADFAWRRASRWSVIALVCGVFWLHALRGTALSEAGVAVLMLAVVLRGFAAYEATYRASIGLGLASGLLVLARLDMVFLLAPMGLYLLWVHRSRAFYPVMWGVVTLVVLCPYLVWNQVTFGHLTPISGATKSTFPDAGFRSSAMPIDYWACLAVSWLSLAVLYFVRAGCSLRSVLFVVTVAASLQSVYLVCFTRFATHWHWYFNLHVVSAALGAGLLLSYLGSLRPLALMVRMMVSRWFQVPLAVCCSLLLCVAVVLLHRGPRQATAVWAELIGEAIPEGSICVVNDSPGMFAFFGGTRIIPTDGLMGDYESHKLFESLGAEAGMRLLGAEYFCWVVGYGQIWHEMDADVSRAGYGRVDIRMKSLILDAWVGSFAFSESDEVLRHFPAETDGTADGFVIWKM